MVEGCLAATPKNVECEWLCFNKKAVAESFGIDFFSEKESWSIKFTELASSKTSRNSYVSNWAANEARAIRAIYEKCTKPSWLIQMKLL